MTQNASKCLIIAQFFSLGIQGVTSLSSHDLEKKLSHTVGNMMNEILFGIHYDENDAMWLKLQKLRENGIKEIEVAAPVNFLPWLRHLVPKFRNTLKWMIDGKIETHIEYQRLIREFSRQNEDCIVGFFYQEKAKLNNCDSPDIQYYR
jgi:ecdysteroid 25-hydroxylase CYP306A1